MSEKIVITNKDRRDYFDVRQKRRDWSPEKRVAYIVQACTCSTPSALEHDLAWQVDLGFLTEKTAAQVREEINNLTREERISYTIPYLVWIGGESFDESFLEDPENVSTIIPEFLEEIKARVARAFAEKKAAAAKEVAS